MSLTNSGSLVAKSVVAPPRDEFQLHQSRGELRPSTRACAYSRETGFLRTTTLRWTNRTIRNCHVFWGKSLVITMRNCHMFYIFLGKSPVNPIKGHVRLSILMFTIVYRTVVATPKSMVNDGQLPCTKPGVFLCDFWQRSCWIMHR